MRATVCRYLRDEGYSISETVSTTSLPALIIIDKTALAWLRELRADRELKEIPCLIISPPSQEALAAGASDFISEPINSIELLARVRALTALYHARQELSQFHITLEDRVSDRTALLERALRGQRALLADVQEARMFWQSTFNAMMDAFVVTDLSGRIKQANSVVADIFAVQPEEAIALNCHDLLATGQACPHDQACEPGTVAEREALNRDHDRLLNLRVSAISDGGGKVIGYSHVIRDITRQRSIERFLMHAERMTLAGKMVSAVAHEAATPLSVVANIAEMLMLDVPPESTTKAELQKIVVQVRRVTEMLRGMLGFVRQTPASFAAVDLAQLARETLDLINYELRKAKVVARLEHDSDALPAWGDRNQLQQVLLNLITNAIQAMKQGGRLLIKTGRTGGSGDEPYAVSLIVEDSGPGIRTDALDTLFDFFFTTRSTEGGTGLGLAITKQIVEGHGGKIRAENIPEGGARFTVILPVALHK